MGVDVAKHIGMVGLSPEGSAACYRALTRRVSEIEDPSLRPIVTMHSPPFANYTDALDADDWESVAAMIADASHVLRDAGADFCILPDNTAHHALPMAEVDSELPFLNMVDIVATHVQRRGWRTVGLIGTSFVTGGATYQSALGLRGVRLLVPTADETHELDDIIFGEAVFGRVRVESVRRMERVMERLAASGCEGLILGYTESSLLMDMDGTSVISVVDPLEALVEEAVLHATTPAAAEAA